MGVLRVISGSAGGLRLLVVPGRDTRPTLDRVRESVFAILAPRLEGARVLDLFAGTGALGIEALSRGAESCLFVDGQPRALSVLRENLERTHLGQRAVVRRLHLPEGIAALGDAAPFDLVLCDPPYAFRRWEELLARVYELGRDGALIVCEHGKGAVPAAVPGLRPVRLAEYGQTQVSFFGRGGD